jgi:hypothetical protein
MEYEMEMVDDLMTLIDGDGHGCDAFVVDPARPWDAVETLVAWGREYDLNEIDALGELRRYLKACR